MGDFQSFEDLLGLRAGLGIAHHVPGRIRLRLGPALADWAECRGLQGAGPQAWLDALGLGPRIGVTGARLNAAAASLVVEYDPNRLDPAWWETLILGDDDEVVALFLDLLANG